MVGGSEVQSKKQVGSWANAGRKAPVFPVPEETVLGGWVNFYKIIKEYPDICRDISNDSKLFILGIKVWSRT